MHNIAQGEMSHFGIKGECVISKTLQHFHPIYGLPPYRLHYLFEGIVPDKTQLRLLPVMVGSKVPEGDEIWTILMDLKEIVQLVLSPYFTEDSIQLSGHRDCRT